MELTKIFFFVEILSLLIYFQNGMNLFRVNLLLNVVLYTLKEEN